MIPSRARPGEITARPLLIVESEPSSLETLEAFLEWQAETHVPEMLSVAGFATARRYNSGGRGYVTIYELDTDVEMAKTNLRSAVAAGRISKPVGMRLEPPPRMSYVTPLGWSPR